MEATELDEFEEKLVESTKKLTECQTQKQKETCTQCEHVIGCETRKEYVDAVYLSMSKGQAKDFEF